MPFTSLIRSLNMKILQVMPYFPPACAFGGPVKVAYQVSSELLKRMHEVVVWTSDAKDSFDAIIFILTLEHRIEHRNLYSIKTTIIHNKNTIIQLPRALDKPSRIKFRATRVYRC